MRGCLGGEQGSATQAIHLPVNSDADETGLTAEERKEKRISEAFPMILEFENWLQNTYLFKKSPILRKRRKGYDRVSLS